MQNKRVIRVRTNRFSADGISMSEIANNRTSGMIKFGLYGMVAGIGYSMLSRSNVLYGMFLGTLLGTLAGTLKDRIKIEPKKENQNEPTTK